jgi:toxin ParE1/3/4
MATVRVQEAAGLRIDEIYRYTRKTWNERQADAYVEGLFAACARADQPQTRSRPIPAAFGVNGFYFRYERHFVYWRRLSNGDIGIVTVLHERMHQLDRFREDAGE